MGKGDRMDSFKTKVGFNKVYRITPANYEKQKKKTVRTRKRRKGFLLCRLSGGR